MEGFHIEGMDKIARKYGVKVIDFKKVPQVFKDVPKVKEIKNVQIAQTIFIKQGKTGDGCSKKTTKFIPFFLNIQAI